MSDFILNKQLKQDSFALADLELCELRLFNNANYPWLLLIPKLNNISEIFELTDADRQQLFAEINAIAARLKHTTQCDKINIATLGNIVSQLHIHVIARFNHDAAWPKPVWGAASLPYADAEHAIAYWQEKLSLPVTSKEESLVT
ncbi:MAG: HIT domain-containing protein [Gammaproteobacteria bacterium]